MKTKFIFYLSMFFLLFTVNNAYPQNINQYRGRVIEVQNSNASIWDYKTGWYGDYVNQNVIDEMTDTGIMKFAGKQTVQEAWKSIIPNYKPGEKIAIKINFNNAIYGTSGPAIDAIPQPVNSLIKGLKSIGVQEYDIWVYDVTHGFHIGEIPKSFMDKIRILYPNVIFLSNDNLHTTSLGYSETQKVHFNVPPDRNITDRPVCKALTEATYLISMPIMKRHRFSGISGAFKLHFGSIEGCDELHWGVTLYDPLYLPTYSPLVDLYNNHNIKDKTVLIIMDGIYGARFNNYNEIPSPWITYGNKSPNSLFFSKDPVAIDSVMCDILTNEGIAENFPVPDGADNYLKLAEKSGLGVYERCDKSGNYKKINLIKIKQ